VRKYFPALWAVFMLISLIIVGQLAQFLYAFMDSVLPMMMSARITPLVSAGFVGMTIIMAFVAGVSSVMIFVVHPSKEKVNGKVVSTK